MTAQGLSAFRRFRALYAPAVPLLLLFLGPLAFALANSSALERDMRIAVTQNMLWVVSQTQMEIMALTQETGRPQPDPAEVSRRFDLTIARLNLMQQGPQARYLEELGYLGVVEGMTAALMARDPLEHEQTERFHAELFDLLRELQPRINRIANDVMTTDWNKSAARLDTYRETQRLVIASVAFALLAAVAISWLLLRNQRRLHLAEVQNLRAANLLEQERDVSAMYRDFAAIVSHQMRTPLSVIDSSMHRLTRLGEDVTAGDVAARRTIVGDAVRRLTRLVDTVLLLAKLDNDQLQARFAPLPMDQVVAALIEEARLRHPDRTLSLSTAKGPLVATGDIDLVGHILDNLVSNALKYSPPDSPVELRVFAQGAEIACAVTDRGEGIDPADQPRLFERYYRGEARAEGQGTGLGLALARELAEAQHGRITFETWPGRGTVFTLWLPANRSGVDDG
jgi:two-component system, OmpR family, sensor kinase